MGKDCLLVRTGRLDYAPAHKMQRRLLGERLAGKIPDVLVLSEHGPVVTLGRGFRRENLLVPRSFLEDRGIPVYEIERGGDATFHGPGQLMGYPVFDLADRGRDVRLFVRSLEKTLLEALSGFGVDAEAGDGGAGVWVEGKKIASIGIAVKKWVTYHGFCLNICPDLKNFSFINPCGLHYNTMTSMEEVLGRRVPLREVEKRVAAEFGKVFKTRFLEREAENAEKR